MHIKAKYIDIDNYNINENSKYDIIRIRMNRAIYDLVHKKDLNSFDCEN